MQCCEFFEITNRITLCFQSFSAIWQAEKWLLSNIFLLKFLVAMQQ